MPTGYGQLNLVKDAATRQLLQVLFDQVSDLQQQVSALQAAALQREAGEITASARIVALADPVNSSDAVTLQSMRRYVAGQLGAFTQPPP